MEITNFGHFKVVERPTRILFFENELGQDWYDIRRGLTEWDAQGNFTNAIYGAWAMVDSNGVVTNVEYDPSRLMPGDKTVLGIDAHHDDIKVGMIYRDGQLIEIEPETPSNG